MGRSGFGRVLAAALAGLLAACTAAPPAPPPPPPPDPAAACLLGLDQRHLVYDRLKDWHTPEGCGIEAAVRVKRSAFEWNRPALMSCLLATRLADFETAVVQPAAERLFGHHVRKMTNVGSYDCRNIRGTHAERMSEHARGLAIDLTGFELDDGSAVSVRRDWHGNGPKSQFLHQVAKGACQYFSVVITPNGNALHQDHFHLDLGPHKYCRD